MMWIAIALAAEPVTVCSEVTPAALEGDGVVLVDVRRTWSFRRADEFEARLASQLSGADACDLSQPMDLRLIAQDTRVLSVRGGDACLRERVCRVRVPQGGCGVDIAEVRVSTATSTRPE